MRQGPIILEINAYQSTFLETKYMFLNDSTGFVHMT